MPVRRLSLSSRRRWTAAPLSAAVVVSLPLAVPAARAANVARVLLAGFARLLFPLLARSLAGADGP